MKFDITWGSSDLVQDWNARVISAKHPDQDGILMDGSTTWQHGNVKNGAQSVTSSLPDKPIPDPIPPPDPANWWDVDNRNDFHTEMYYYGDYSQEGYDHLGPSSLATKTKNDWGSVYYQRGWISSPWYHIRFEEKNSYDYHEIVIETSGTTCSTFAADMNYGCDCYLSNTKNVWRCYWDANAGDKATLAIYVKSSVRWMFWF